MFRNIKYDLKRLGSRKSTLRPIVRGLLSQGFQAIIVYRFFNWLHRHHVPAQPFRFIVERLTEITTGISIPAECTIGPGLRIHHFGGIILHPSVVIGENCTIYHHVTIGDRGGSGNAARIGNNVLFGAGAKIIGEIVIGDNCRVGANAVVNRDVPENSVVFAAPCIIRKQTRKGIS